MLKVTAITTAALVFLSAGHAAAEADPPATATVSFADLDLTKVSGREALQHRIEAAAARVCAEDASALSREAMYNYGLCRDLARAGAKRQVAAAYRNPRSSEASIKVGSGNR